MSINRLNMSMNLHILLTFFKAFQECQFLTNAINSNRAYI